MNIFLIHPDAAVSGTLLYNRDPLRANKQIVECAQLLAFYEIRHTGITTLLSVSGEPYKATKSQLNHPIAAHMYYHKQAYQLCWDVVQGLLAEHPEHACGVSLGQYTNLEHMAQSNNEEYLVCRRGHAITYAKDRTTYASYMLDYMISAKGMRV